MLVSISMPHPPRSCSPNGGHGHWLPAWRAKRALRRVACANMMTAMSEKGVTPATFKPVGYRVVWYFWRTVQPDDDNVLARCKAILDGCADALGMNDRDFRLLGVTCKRAETEEARKSVVIIFEDGKE